LTHSRRLPSDMETVGNSAANMDRSGPRADACIGATREGVGCAGAGSGGNWRTQVHRRKDGIRPSWWTGSLEVARSRPQRPLAAPERAAWTCAAASPAFGSVWRHRCGRCRPLRERVLRSSSARADIANQSMRGCFGKTKDRIRELCRISRGCDLSCRPLGLTFSYPGVGHKSAFGCHASRRS